MYVLSRQACFTDQNQQPLCAGPAVEMRQQAGPAQLLLGVLTNPDGNSAPSSAAGAQRGSQTSAELSRAAQGS